MDLLANVDGALSGVDHDLGTAHGMAHQEEGYVGRENRLKERGDVVNDALGGTAETALGLLSDGASPSSKSTVCIVRIK